MRCCRGESLLKPSYCSFYSQRFTIGVPDTPRHYESSFVSTATESEPPFDAAFKILDPESRKSVQGLIDKIGMSVDGTLAPQAADGMPPTATRYTRHVVVPYFSATNRGQISAHLSGHKAGRALTSK